MAKEKTVQDYKALADEHLSKALKPDDRNAYHLGLAQVYMQMCVSEQLKEQNTLLTELLEQLA